MSRGFPIPLGTLPSSADLHVARGPLADAAKSVFDDWYQDEDGMDDVYGAGGICHEIASAMVAKLAEVGIEHAVPVHASVGENHVFVVALLEDGIFSIDIPPHVYETGSGYVWRKRHDAEFVPASVFIDRIGDPLDPEAFYDFYND